jgi:lysophospholipase L1-like esterase
MGEVYFRFHPEQVGGGGGGNPALRYFYKGLYQTNTHGLRDSEFPLEPSEHESRILVLGDSFTYGQGVTLEETFPQRIEALLNRGGTEDRVFQVINGGKAGANTRWEVEFLKNKGWAFEPDLVVLQFFANDIELTTAPKEKSQNRILELFFRKPLSRSYVAFFLRFHFDQWVRSLYVRADENLPKDWLWGVVEKVEANHPAWRECKEAFKELAAACREKGVPVVVVLFPHPGELHGAIKDIHEAVAQVCLESGLPCLDLIDRVKGMAPEMQIVTEFDHHPSSAYHALAARCVVDRLHNRWPALIR